MDDTFGFFSQAFSPILTRLSVKEGGKERENEGKGGRTREQKTLALKGCGKWTLTGLMTDLADSS